MNFSIEYPEQIFKPGLWGQSHASTLIRQPDGTFLAAWFAGTKEGAADVSIFGAVRDTGGSWSAPVRWARVCDSPHWNPVLFRPDDHRTVMFFKEGRCPDSWRTWWTETIDGRLSWSDPVELVPGDIGGRGPVKNKPVVLSDGSWLAPNSLEADNVWRVVIERSADDGKTWRPSVGPEIDRSLIRGQGAIQPTLWESLHGKVHMLVRSSCGFLCRSNSNDFGITWSPLTPTKLPNNNSGVDLARDSEGTLLLAYNPVPKDWGPRTPLKLSMSNDNGETWVDIATLEDAPGEYSYPAVIAVPGGFAGTYTWKRETIAFWQGRLER